MTKPIYHSIRHRKTEFGTSSEITARPTKNGGVLIEITHETEYNDGISMAKEISIEEAIKFGHALISIEDTFAGLAQRAGRVK